MTAWLVGLLVGAAALGLGYAAVDATLSVVARARALGLGSGQAGRRRAVLRAYRPPVTAERVVLPPALYATLVVLRRPAPLHPAAGCRRPAPGRPDA